MNKSEPIMKVRNADYLEWQTKIQQLKEDNLTLKSKLANQKYLDRDEVEKIVYALTDEYEIQEDINTKELLLVGKEIEDFITAICQLVIK